MRFSERVRIHARWFRGLVRVIYGPPLVRYRIRSAGDNLRLVVGASGIYQRGWIRTEQEYFNLLDGRQMEALVGSNKLTAMLAEHVWEHLTPAEGRLAAINCRRLLKPGGYLRLAVPDALHPDPVYREHSRIGGAGPGADDHKTFYSWRSLSEMLEKVGYQVERLEYWDENGVFHRTEWKEADGMIWRSARHDRRNHGATLQYTSLIVDARKPINSAEVNE